MIYGIDSTPYPEDEGRDPRDDRDFDPEEADRRDEEGYRYYDPEEADRRDEEEDRDFDPEEADRRDRDYDYYETEGRPEGYDYYERRGGDGQNFTMNINNDFDFKLNQTSKVSSMRVKFLDYFDYAIVDVKDKKISRDELAREGCIDECGTGEWSQMCCA